MAQLCSCCEAHATMLLHMNHLHKTPLARQTRSMLAHGAAAAPQQYASYMQFHVVIAPASAAAPQPGLLAALLLLLTADSQCMHGATCCGPGRAAGRGRPTSGPAGACQASPDPAPDALRPVAGRRARACRTRWQRRARRWRAWPPTWASRPAPAPRPRWRRWRRSAARSTAATRTSRRSSRSLEPNVQCGAEAVALVHLCDGGGRAAPADCAPSGNTYQPWSH